MKSSSNEQIDPTFLSSLAGCSALPASSKMRTATMDHHEPDVEGLIREGARAGAREVKLRYFDRRLVLIYIFVVVMAASVTWIGRDYSNDVQHRIEQRFCVFLVPLLPQTSREVPTSGYGHRILSGIKQGTQQNHCKVPKS